MSKLLKNLNSKGLINPPSFVLDNTQYLGIMGSQSYGTSNDDSDWDIYGFVIPPKTMIFPHLDGELLGFGRQKKRFKTWQQHHVEDSNSQKQYDFQLYSIIQYFHLCMENNPSIIDSLFVPHHCILHSTHVGNLVRENRKLFLHKGSWFKFKGYAFSQVNKMQSQTRIGDRAKVVEEFGYDLKFGMHCVRLLNEIEQILTEGDLNLQRNRGQLKAIRRGDWTKEQILDYFSEKEKTLEELYTKSKLPHKPDEKKIKELLLNCLEHHYGNLSNCIVTQDRYITGLKDIRTILDKLGVY